MGWGAFVGAGTRVVDMASRAATWERAGVGQVWTGEVAGVDSVTATARISAATESATVGLVWNVYLRSVPLSAMTIAALADGAAGRLDVAFGVSSPLLVTQWHGVAFEHPVQRMVDTLTGLRAAFNGERLAGGFKLDLPPVVVPRFILASTGPRMLREAGPLADGVLVNWCTYDDLQLIPGLPDDPGSISAMVYVCPTADVEEARAAARRLMGGYLSAPGYAALQRLVGRGPAFAEYWRLVEAGDRRAAAAAIPDEVVDQLVVHGSPSAVRNRLGEWERRGLTPLVSIVGPNSHEARLEALALDPLPSTW